MKRRLASLLLCVLLADHGRAQEIETDHDAGGPAINLRGWRETIWLPYEIDILGIEPRDGSGDAGFYLWFYEHTLFDALERGHSTFHGPRPTRLTVGGDGLRAEFIAPDERRVNLTCEAVEDGADLLLTVTNHTDYAWPEPAGLIPCFFPGSPDPDHPDPPIHESLRDEDHTRTYFLGADGLEALENRDIHYDHDLRSQIDNIYAAGEVDFSVKWPRSQRYAHAGLMVRESADGEWVAGIAWEDYVSVQGHNPLRCMHLGVRLGPLEPSRTKSVRGKIYLFKGTKEDCLRRFSRDFKLAIPSLDKDTDNEHAASPRFETNVSELIENGLVPPEETAVLVVDMQNEFLSTQGGYARQGSDEPPDPARHQVLPRFQDEVHRLQTLLEAARRRDVLVIYTKFITHHDSGAPVVEAPILWRFRDRPWAPRLREESWAANIIPELAPRQGDIVLRKTSENAFLNTSLKQILEDRGAMRDVKGDQPVRTVLITGLNLGDGLDPAIMTGYGAAMDGFGWNRVIPILDCLCRERRLPQNFWVDHNWKPFGSGEVIAAWERLGIEVSPPEPAER